MKRIFLLILFCCFGIALYAQEHLTFKNIPIKGAASNFVAKLESQGFVVAERRDGLVTMKGTYVGLNDCQILIATTKKTQTVWKVVAWLPEQVSWSSTRSRYEDFKEKFTEKYGSPTKSYEFFVSPYELGDGYELQAISLEKGYYNTYWESELGIIAVEIDALSNSRGWVKFVYEDATSAKVMSAEKNAVIEDDI